MAIRYLYCSVTNTTGIISATVTSNHDSPTTNAIIEAHATSLGLGNSISIDMGYVDSHTTLFTGYVKQVEQKFPEGTYIITAGDAMIRAQDYFIAADNPATPLKYKNIKAEKLIENLMGLAGLSSYDGQDTSFTFGVQSEFEINLVYVYEYCKMITEAITYHLWADQNGQIHMRNRKPYVMINQSPENTQPGWTADTNTSGYTLIDDNIIEMGYSTDEKNLRNRVVVYGNEGIYATATRNSNTLPAGFYKTAVIAVPGIIDSTGLAQDIAEYNIDLLDRVTQSVRCTVLGDIKLLPRLCCDSNTTKIPLTGLWYIFSCEHNLSGRGYQTNLDLRRMVRDD